MPLSLAGWVQRPGCISMRVTTLESSLSWKHMERLRTLLKDLLHFDLSGKIYDINPKAQNLGATCDVFVGYLGTGQDRVKVGIKKMRIFLSREEMTAKRLAREMKIWSTLKHRNVLPLLGYFIEDKDFPNFITEWMENGSLFYYLKISSGGLEFLSIISGVASGLNYLHKEGVIHADLKSPNVLISATKEPLLADFGLSKVLQPLFSTAGHNTDSITGTLRWMAPELLTLADIPVVANERSDIWAFGMVLYELLGREVPFSDFEYEIQVLTAISSRKLPSKPDLSNDPPLHYYEANLWELCNMCWALPLERPPMCDIEASIASLSKEAKALFDPPCDNSFLMQSDFAELTQTIRREGECWAALLNPTQEDISELKDLAKIPCRSQIRCVRFSPTGKIVAIACVASIRLIDIVENKEICTLTLDDPQYITDMCFSPNDTHLAVSAESLPASAKSPRNGHCVIWYLRTEEILHDFLGHTQEINAVAFSTDSRSVVTGSSDCTARLWDIQSRQERLFKVDDTQEDVDAGICSVAISSTELLATGCFDNVIRLWNVDSGDLIGNLTGHTGAVYCTTFSVDGRYLFSGSLDPDNSLRCWNIGSLEDFSPVRSDEEEGTLSRGRKNRPYCKFSELGHREGILDVARSVCGKWIASCSLDQTIVFWNTKNGHAPFLIKVGCSVKSISVTNGTHGGVLAAVAGDDEVKLWTFAFKQPYTDM